jgi:ATP-dependent Lhr-like helicase
METKITADEHNLMEHLAKPSADADVDKLLHPWVKTWFYKRFPSLSLPQKFAVPRIHARENILVSAPTGATKTLTGFLAILNELVDSADKGLLEDRVYCIYISPLKALGNDIHVNLLEPLKQIEEVAGKSLGIRVAVRTGDTPTSQRQRMLKKPPHILITTPESLAIGLVSKKFGELLKRVDWVIVDEIHALCDNKRGVDLSLSLERLHRLSGHLCRVGLSATVAPVDDVAGYLVGPNRPCLVVEVPITKNLDLKVMSPVADLIDTPHFEAHKAMYELIHKLIQEHRTTLIFTNTRAATERVVDTLKDRFPGHYLENIGAHHGSLSAEHRRNIEKRLREGSLKVVVSSTSLELGIDIGYIDLVICLGSPKSVARFLQRAGRSGHRLHETVKGRLIVMDRDDLVECAVLLKSALDKKIDRLHIPTNCLDVLAQQLDAMAIEQIWEEEELFTLVRQSWCYKDLVRKDFDAVLAYLAGSYVDLEDRHIYAKIWRDTGKLGKRGKLGRMLYMTNAGTIPEESFITVKVGEQVIGHLDEGFLERLRPGDVFVLGGETYQFKFSRGMVAQVSATANRPPTVPRWVSEMLPLSYDLALEIGRTRRLIAERVAGGEGRPAVVAWLETFLSCDENAANAIYDYVREQYEYSKAVADDKTIVIEYNRGEREPKVVVHALFGRRVTDCLSRAVAFAIGRTEHRDVEVGINDNGFYIGADRKINVAAALKLIKADKLHLVMRQAIENSEVFKRRFRHCAMRSLMILRSYAGRTKNVGRQQVGSQILLKAVERIDQEFPILKEARREVLEDLMDIGHCREVLAGIETGRIRIIEIDTQIPTPFAFNLVVQGYSDIMRIEEKQEFLHRLHEQVMAKIALEKGKKATKAAQEAAAIEKPSKAAKDYAEIWKDEEARKDEKEREE